MQNSPSNKIDLALYREEKELIARLGGVSRKRRIELGLSENELCRRATLDMATLMSFEIGNLDIDILSLRTMADCLSTSLKSLFEESELTPQKNLTDHGRKSINSPRTT